MISRRIAMGLTVVAVGAITMYHNVAPAKVSLTQQEADGKAVYLKSCKECHGVIGTPTKASMRKYDKIATFADPAFFKTRTDAKLIEAVEKGKGRDMKGFADKLSKEEIKAVVAYVHTLEKKG